MLAFYPQFTRTFNDLPDHISLLVHSWNGCNMQCYGCHNYEELIAQKPQDFLSSEEVVSRLQDGDMLFDAVLFSGGEFLLNETSEVLNFLQDVRMVFKGKIIVLSNGTYPHKLEQLFTNDLIDGAHIDMKLPYHCLDPYKNQDIYEAVLGIRPTAAFCEQILKSVEMTIRHNSIYSQIRTVHYPLLSPEYFEEINCYVDQLKTKYNSDVPYFLHPYHSS